MPRNSYREFHGIGVGYLHLRPSPEETPRIRRQIQGSTNVAIQIEFSIVEASFDFLGAGPSGSRHFGSCGYPSPSKTA